VRSSLRATGAEVLLDALRDHAVLTELNPGGNGLGGAVLRERDVCLRDCLVLRM